MLIYSSKLCFFQFPLMQPRLKIGVSGQVLVGSIKLFAPFRLLRSMAMVFVLLSFTTAWADSVSEKSSRCRVGVRVVRGSSRTPEGEHKRLYAGKYLADLKEQLEPLPFLHYKTIIDDKQFVPLKEKGMFHLLVGNNEEHTLAITPESSTEEGVNIMVEWKGVDGEEVLSSKLRVVNDQNVVLGTDRNEDSSTIVCIKVNCLK